MSFLHDSKTTDMAEDNTQCDEGDINLHSLDNALQPVTWSEKILKLTESINCFASGAFFNYFFANTTIIF